MTASLLSTTAELPHSENIFFERSSERVAMEFRLIYEGPLGSGSRTGRVEEKHSIRKQFHTQLKALWEDHPLLRKGVEKKRYQPYLNDPSTWFESSPADAIADEYKMFGYRFLPLIRKSQGVTCSLDILFLRKDVPGGIIANRGDLDNRIKVLFDGLRIPENGAELPKGIAPEADEDPFFCLLQDDKLIADLRVTSDRLLRPVKPSEPPNSRDISQVVLVLGVKVKENEADDWSCHFIP